MWGRYQIPYSRRVIGSALAAAANGLAPEVRDRIFARIVGPLGAEARATSRELARKPSAATRADRAAIVAAVRAPTPPGLRGVHGSWIEHAIRDLPFAARAAVAGATEPRPPVMVWLARWACAEIPPMPPLGDEVRPFTSIDAVLGWSEAAVARWLHEVGADQLAYSTSAAGEAMALAVARRYPAVRAAIARIATAPRVGQLGPARGAVERCTAPLDDTFLLRIGARAVAPHVARSSDPFAATILARRLPRPHGLVVEAELRARARDPIDRGPALVAISA